MKDVKGWTPISSQWRSYNPFPVGSMVVNLYFKDRCYDYLVLYFSHTVKQNDIFYQ
jgi:hypothetical protein